MSCFSTHALPDQAVTITDDATAETILTELGIMEKLRQHHVLACAAIGAVHVHATHLVGIVWFRGYAHPSQNGFVLRLIPRTLMDKAGMLAAITQTLAQHSAENVPPVRIDC